MRKAGQGHARLLGGQYAGRILRAASPADEQIAERLAERSQLLFLRSRVLVADLHLPMEMLDAEILLDGRQAVLHHLRWTDGDPRPLMDKLGDEFRLLVTLHDLVPPGMGDSGEDGGCGSPNCSFGHCGSCQAGSCSSCGARQRGEASGGRPASRAQTKGSQEVRATSAVLTPAAEPPERFSLL
jgi:hypothetical protein